MKFHRNLCSIKIYIKYIQKANFFWQFLKFQPLSPYHLLLITILLILCTDYPLKNKFYRTPFVPYFKLYENGNENCIELRTN